MKTIIGVLNGWCTLVGAESHNPQLGAQGHVTTHILLVSVFLHGRPPPIMCVESLLITVLEFSKATQLLSFKLPHFIVRETDKEKKENESKEGKDSSFLFLLFA